jgi:outer membrane biosynthesis protein TonB
MTTPWIRAQDRRRNFLAAASTACIYAMAIGIVWAAGLLSPTKLSDRAGTIIVDLGGTEGDLGDIPLGLPSAPDRPPDAEAGAAPLPAKGAEEPAPAPEASSAKNVIPVPTPPAPVKTTAPVKPAPAKPAPTKAPTPAAKTAPTKTAKTIPEPDAKEPEPAPAGPTAEEIEAQQKYEAALAAARATAAARTSGSTTTKKFGSSSGTSGAPVASATGTGSTPGVAGGTGTATFKGIEMGNALSTTFGASQGDVGRNLYVPIYLFMPLPQSVDDAIFQRIGAKDTFKKIYEQSGSSWTLKAQVPLAQRGDYWRVLEDAGYDPAKADYKAGRKLKPVSLEFAVASNTKGGNVELIDVRLVSSSGSSEIDEAVVYGFKQSAFFNKTGNAVSGKFVHSF